MMVGAGASLTVLVAERGEDLLPADETPSIPARTSRTYVAAGVDVGMKRVSAADAAEQVSGFAVARVGASAVRTFLRCVCGVDFGDGDALVVLQVLEFALDRVASRTADDAVHPAGESAVAEVEFLYDDFLDVLFAQPVEQPVGLVGHMVAYSFVQPTVTFRFPAGDMAAVQLPFDSYSNLFFRSV